MNKGVMEYLKSYPLLKSDYSRFCDRAVYLVPHRTFHEEQYRVNAYPADFVLRLPPEAQKVYKRLLLAEKPKFT